MSCHCRRPAGDGRCARRGLSHGADAGQDLCRLKAAEVPEGSLPAGAELLDAIAAIDRVLAVQVRDWVETFGDQAPKPPGWIPSLQAPATLAAHRIYPQKAQANPTWRAGEKILQKVRSCEWRLGYFPPGDPAGTLQAFDDAIARLTPADFRFGRSRIMFDEVLIPVRCILAAREVEPGHRESRTPIASNRRCEGTLPAGSCRSSIWPASHPTRFGTSRLTWQPDTVHLGRPAASPASAY
jgi:hypothetical protein